MLNNLSTSQNSPSPASLIPKSEKAINRKVTLVPNISTQILAANANRHYAEIINLSDKPITLYFGDGTALINEGLVMMSKGSTYAITQINLFTGRIAAISSTTSDLAFVECSF